MQGSCAHALGSLANRADRGSMSGCMQPLWTGSQPAMSCGGAPGLLGPRAERILAAAFHCTRQEV